MKSKMKLMLGAAACLAIPNLVHAQAQTRTVQSAVASENSTGQAAKSQSVGLDDIVVTATRSETKLQNTSVAVTALSASALEERNVSTITDVAQYVPSLSIGTRAGTGTAAGGISIRGMGVDATSSSAAVGIYVDDVYFASDHGNLLGLLDVDRLEVLRGPQGTLFGRNTIAGAIQYVTRQPDHQLGGFLTATIGEVGRRAVQGALNVPLTDNLAIRFSGMTDEHGGYIHDNLNNIDRGADTIDAGRVKVRWTPTDRLTVDLKGEILTERANGRPVLITAVDPNGQFSALANLIGGETRVLNSSYISTDNHSFAGYNSPDFFRFNYKGAQGILNYQLSDTLSIKSITAKSWTRFSQGQDFDLTPLSILSSLIQNDKLDVFTQELQLSGKLLDGHLNFTLGGYYYDSTQTENPGRLLGLGFLPAGPLGGSPETKILAKALYGQATYNFTDKLSVTGGLRYSTERNTSKLIGQTVPTPVTFKNWSPHIGLNYQATPDVRLYVKASRGFRAGGVTPNALLPGQQQSFDPETAWTYEAGARIELFNRHLRFNPTVFWTDWKNIQFNSLVPTPAGPAAVTANAGNARIRGIELETQYVATDRLQFNGSLSVLDAKYTKVGSLSYATYPLGWALIPEVGPAPLAVVTLPNLTTNSPLQRAPKFKFSVGARYTQPFASGELVGSIDYAHTSSQRSNVTDADLLTIPAYGLLNGRVQYNAPDKRWSLAVYATNLLNQFYLIGGTTFAKGYTAGVDEADPARPREIGAELTVHF